MGLSGVDGPSRVEATGCALGNPGTPLAGEEQTGCGETLGAASGRLGLSGPMGPVHVQGSQLLQGSHAAAGRHGDAQPAQLSLLCQSS